MTSWPASARARATTLAPRSCPSSPGLATRIRILRADSLTARLLDELPRDDDALDLARPLVDARDPDVAARPLDREIARVAVAAVDLQREVADDAGALGGQELAHGRLAAEREPPVLAPRGPQHHEARRLQPGGAVGQHVADRLVLRDRHAEGDPLLRVGQRRLERHARDAERLRRDADAAAVERRHRQLEAAAELAEQRVVADLDVLEGEPDRARAAQAHLVL